MYKHLRAIGSSAIVLAAIVTAWTAGADEWIDLFDHETLFGWTQFGDAEWGVRDGNMVCMSGSGGCLATTSQFADFELAAKLRVSRGGATGLMFRASLEGHPSENGTLTIRVSEPKDAKPDWREIRVTAEGEKVTVTVDGNAVDVVGGGRMCGYVGILYHAKSKIEVASVRLRPLNMKPLFNGKDLEGWNILPDHASKFAVVDGAINITNGNGQIETAGTYRDFLLQLDIISNGDHLNSGVFFRGPVGEFWRGYESQVRNQWLKDDRTRPVDFGTGGLYGNQPARKVVSSDGEWFTKTIVCKDNHMAVWINGYLASDYLDVRAISESANGKEGYIPGPGTIHLQGHDPTTDLSFKSIQIQEYPAK